MYRGVGTTISEKVLGIIKVSRLAFARPIIEILFFTPYRVIVAEIAEINSTSRGAWSEDVFGFVLAVIEDVESRKKMEKKEKGYLELPVEDVLKADENNFDVPYSEITKVELKKKWLGGIEIKMEIMDEEIEGKTYWGKWSAIGIVEKEKAKIEDYENMLRPIFGDKLSVEK